jgi:2-C-methyl-D-erythritol 4-phosphate cytidylyltransferase
MDTGVILLAAGRGERMGGERPKAFLDLAGQPLLYRSARAFDGVSDVSALVAVVPAGLEEEAGTMLGALEAFRGVATGGPRRQDSVLEGLRALPAGFEGVVLVHDAARPFVGRALIEAVARAAAEHGAALPVLPIVETVKRVRDGLVQATLEREELAAAQTPQGFRYALLGRAYEEAFRDRVLVTDEAMAVERIGEPVVALPGDPLNRKLTTPEDWAWAEGVLGRQGELA